MSTRRDEIIQQLEVKLDMLSKRYAELEKSRQILNALKEENALLKQKYETLNMAKTLAPTEQDVHTTRVQLSRMIRQIDTCISLLSVEK
ncbi:MAG: hypothetical protein J5729_03075 [Bacteroidaceae bacterium]|nr:hypothetical protein [Bacteroidaceae bacterium]MBR4783298.1 hypothetical protein [Bacteroidaceae bacterium]